MIAQFTLYAVSVWWPGTIYMHQEPLRSLHLGVKRHCILGVKWEHHKGRRSKKTDVIQQLLYVKWSTMYSQAITSQSPILAGWTKRNLRCKEFNWLSQDHITGSARHQVFPYSKSCPLSTDTWWKTETSRKRVMYDKGEFVTHLFKYSCGL